MGKPSRDKGKRGEREFAAVLIDHGFTARRGVQYSGGVDSPDVICTELHDVHFEVKRVEKPNLKAAYAQAFQDAGIKEPVVVTRQNGQQWMTYCSAAYFIGLQARIKSLEESLYKAQSLLVAHD